MTASYLTCRRICVTKLSIRGHIICRVVLWGARVCALAAPRVDGLGMLYR